MARKDLEWYFRGSWLDSSFPEIEISVSLDVKKDEYCDSWPEMEERRRETTSLFPWMQERKTLLGISRASSSEIHSNLGELIVETILERNCCENRETAILTGGTRIYRRVLMI